MGNIRKEDFSSYEEYRDAQQDFNDMMEHYEKEDIEEASRKAVQEYKSISLTGTEFLNND